MDIRNLLEQASPGELERLRRELARRASRRAKAGKHPVEAFGQSGARAQAHVRKLPPGRHCDGLGLYLLKEPSGSARWVWRGVVFGKRVDLGLGGWPKVSVAKAREQAKAIHAQVRAKEDPRRQRQAMTFEQAARLVHAEHTRDCSLQHAKEWWRSLERHVLPELGRRKIADITGPEVLNALDKVWRERYVTATRIKSRVSAIFDWAIAHGHRQAGNPVAGIAKGLGKRGKDQKKKPMGALTFEQAPEFICQLRGEERCGESARLAFEFLTLTVSRSKETRFAEWTEIDWENRVWVVPAERMKMRRPWRVPLSDRCMEILRRAKELSNGSRYIFPGSALRQWPRTPLFGCCAGRAMRTPQLTV